MKYTAFVLIGTLLFGGCSSTSKENPKDSVVVCLDESMSPEETTHNWVGYEITLPPCWDAAVLTSIDDTAIHIVTARGTSQEDYEEIYINASLEGSELKIEIRPGYENDAEVLEILESLQK